ncbi:hypothetical protein GCM10022286_23970 [Gryllotalpicola daejeonensis]|uniref:Carbohydrate-binding module family 96 domain-containing protein n=1 Tax=Gryllotalpicola daejeonensis TaxID=993087 RepID=A0ABP7ZLT5_9MICO
MLVVTVLVPGAGDAASAAPAPAKAPKRAAVTVAPDAVSAQVDARAQGRQVEVLSERTETSQTFVNPDGSFTSKSTAGIARVRDTSAKDGWRDVDLTLTTRADGTIAPVSPVNDVVINGGGAGSATSPLVSVADRTGADSVALSWPEGDLPKPKISGDTATYKDVRPGQDLVIQATRTGFEQFLVLKSKPASAQEAKLSLPVTSHGLFFTAKKSGGDTSVVVMNKAGKVLGGLGDAVVTDARVDAKTGAPEHTDVADQSVQTVSGKQALVISPSQEYLDAATYPVTVDPSVSLGSDSADTYIDSGFPTTNYNAATLLHVGTYDSGTHVARALVRFDGVPISGTQILAATLNLWAEHSSSCTATPFTIYPANSAIAYPSITWNNQPAINTGNTVTASSAAGSSCTAAGWVSTNVVTPLQYWATGAATTVGLEVRASETSNASYKRFNSANMGSYIPSLTVTYNRYAGTPTSMSVVGQYTVDSVHYVSTKRPTLQAMSTDADGDSVTLLFELYNANTFAAANKLGTCTVSGGTSGHVYGCSVAVDLADNTTYYWRVGAHDSHSTTFTYAVMYALTTAIAKPAAPVLSCPAPYSSGAWLDAPPAANVSCTITAAASALSTAPVKITSSVDGAAAASVAFAKGTAGSQTVTVAKTIGAHTITAYTTSVDAVNSATVTYSFGYGQASITSPLTGFKTANTVHVVAAGPPLGSASSATAQLEWSGPGVAWTQLDAATTVSPATSGGPVPAAFDWDTTKATGDEIDPRQVTTLQLRVHYAYTGGPSQYTAPITVVRIPHAFGDGFPTADAGSGQVALWTGELETSSSDVSVTTAADSLGISRDFYSYQGPQNAVTGIFGPGWSASLDGSGLGYAGAQVVDQNLQRTTGQAADQDLILAGTADGDLVFSPPAGATGPSPAGAYTPVGDDTAQTLTTLTVTSSSGVKTLTATQHDGTVTTWTLSSASGAPTWTPAGVAQAGQQGSERFSADATGHITRILAAQPYDDGLTCPATGTLNPGCAALTLSYTGTGTDTRLHEVDYTAYDPATAAMKITPVASYTYDAQSRLAAFTDRSGLTTTYTYTTNGNLTLLASETAAGQAPWTYAYDSAGKLKDVTRGPASGTGSDATATSIAYALSPTAAGMPDVTAATVQKWGQQSAPTHAWAVFGLDHPVTGNPAASDLPYGQLYFTDDEGYTVNTAQWGAGRWLVTWQAYDESGSPTDSLTGAQTQAAVAETSTGSADTGGPQTITRYLPAVLNDDDPADPLVPANTTPSDIWSPVYEASDSNGNITEARQHTHIFYDTGAPNDDVKDTGKPYLLPTEVVVTVAGPDSASTDPDQPLPTGEAVISDTVYGYDPIDGQSPTGPSSGWTLGQPTTTTKVLTAFGEPNVTTKTLYDAHGAVLETLAPGANSADSLTTKTIRYTAGTNSDDAPCGDKPQWTGLECWTGPAAAPAQGPDIADTRITGYDYWLNPTTTIETSGTGDTAATRTTTDTYHEDDGRPDTESITTSNLEGSTPVPTTQVRYDPATKQQIGTSTLNAAGQVTSYDEAAYDAWGRQVSYRNSLDDTTTTTYVAPGQPGAGQVKTVTTSVSTSAYSYDGTDADGNIEHRGLATGLSVSGVGSYTAAYNADGKLTTQTLPGGITQQLSYDASGRVISLEYDGQQTDQDGNTTVGSWLAFSRAYNQNGQVLHDWSPAGASNTPTGYSKQYSYDGAGRLITVDDATDPDSGDTTCTVRQYSFDGRGNRTSLTATSDPDGCTTDANATGATQTFKAWTYDADSRQLTGANGAGTYTYDALGRQTSLPAADAPDPANGDVALSYFDTDAVHTITQGDTTTTYDLDPDGRRLTASTAGNGAGTVTNHYGDSSDNAAWATTADTSGVKTTTYTPSIAAGLAASLTNEAGNASASLDLADIGGSIVATMTIPSTGDATNVDGYSSYDEYGNLESAPPSTGSTQYGWQGTQQRATGGAGLTLMGARLYDSISGRFTSRDTVTGGNENAYIYPNDPVNYQDITGKISRAFILQLIGTAAWVADFVGMVTGNLVIKFIGTLLGLIDTFMTCRSGWTSFSCIYGALTVVVSVFLSRTIARLLMPRLRPFAFFFSEKFTRFVEYKITAYSLVFMLVGWVGFLSPSLKKKR